jgi:DNA-directed RNA polymerase specialized sigma24 family protein
MTTIDHAGALAVSRPDALSDEHVASRALQVARRTALGVLGDAEAAADIAQDVAITAVRRAGSLREPAALRRLASPDRRARGTARGPPGRPAPRGRAGRARPAAGARRRPGGKPRAPRRPARSQRAALTLRYVHDLPDAAIASALRCRPGTVRSLLSRGRDAVRAAIDEDRSPHANH